MRVVHTPGSVAQKYLINSTTFPFGYVTTDNRWDNYWREGSHANLEWRGPNSGGYGPKTLGEEVAASRAFSVCQVEKVFQHVCFRPPNSNAGRRGGRCDRPDVRGQRLLDEARLRGSRRLLHGQLNDERFPG